MRAAIYFTPLPGDPLTRCAADWLGRDAFSGRPTRQPDPTIDPLVADAARYGFHATIKAPFRLAPGRSIEELGDRLARFSRGLDDVAIGTLRISRLDGFFALTPSSPTAALARLETATRMVFDDFRAPLSNDEIAKRRPERLTDRQRAGLFQWGYPHVGPDFRFHMTLAAMPAADAEARSMERRLLAHFDHVLRRAVTLDALTLFMEPAPGEPFLVRSRHPLRAPLPLGVLAP